MIQNAILNILVPSSCENVERSYSQVSSITQDESQESKVCVSSMQVIVNETIDDVIVDSFQEGLGDEDMD